MESGPKCREDSVVGGFDVGRTQRRVCRQRRRLENVARRQIQIRIHRQFDRQEKPRIVRKKRLSQTELSEAVIVGYKLLGYISVIYMNVYV